MNKTLELLTKPFRRRKRGAAPQVQPTDEVAEAIQSAQPVEPPPDFELAPDDPLNDYFRANPTVALLEKIQIESPALEKLKAAGIKLVVPLVSQGELIGMLNLGPRLSEQDYSSDDITLLNNLAAQATPAVRVAQLVREQQEEAKERERLDQELRVARLIQQTLLPKELPEPSGWSVQAYYQPARAVGGDFYDFVELPDNHLGIFVGDVTDKGVPAALVMATTRRVLRFAAMADSVDGKRYATPGQVLEQANNLLCPDIPDNMFVTCMYAVLNLSNGNFRYANAGHNPPYRWSNGQTDELRATGMPLGLMPGMGYEERQAVLKEGEYVMFYSDGLTEAHNAQREMFGFERVMEVMNTSVDRADFISQLLNDIEAFTGPGWEQEDDVSLVVLNRHTNSDQGESQLISAFEIPSEPGNERMAMRQVAEVVQPMNIDQSSLDRLKTAVAEATMNAMEHGNRYQPDKLVDIEVWSTGSQVKVIIRDHGGNQPIPEASTPDLNAKLAGEQSPRGWGLFLIENMVDELHVSSDDTHHTLELVIDTKGKQS